MLSLELFPEPQRALRMPEIDLQVKIRSLVRLQSNTQFVRPSFRRSGEKMSHDQAGPPNRRVVDQSACGRESKIVTLFRRDSSRVRYA